MDIVRIGVIGVGNMGGNHVGYLANGDIPGAKLTALCDTNAEQLARMKALSRENVATFEEADALMQSDQIDAVIVATPHYDHPPLAIKALERGLHVMIEKPAGVYTRQVREMNEAAEKSDRIFGLMFNQRTLGQHQKLKELVGSGELGELRRTNYIITSWFRAQSYYDSGGWRATWAGEGGGVLANQCPHNLDLWQWICGMPVRMRAFCAFGKYHTIEVEDDVTAYVEYENGATGVFITTTGEAPGTNRMEITGDNGKVVMEEGKITFWRNRTPAHIFNKEWKGGFGSPETWECEIPFKSGGEEHRGITQNWVQAILNGTPLLAPAVEGINGVQLSNAMLLSTWLDDWVDIPVDENLYYEKLQERINQSTINKDPSESRTLDVDGTF
ncbi:MAG: Gfo/Idh/MocA family oxidoreductase [Candidatus Latescibacteria bacterium]|jgi:predicted dehydrogenase|nr:Gfo/Idh/MocA family oxidoreductase [Candidatus Latescibacterota bacterium]